MYSIFRPCVESVKRSVEKRKKSIQCPLPTVNSEIVRLPNTKLSIPWSKLNSRKSKYCNLTNAKLSSPWSRFNPRKSKYYNLKQKVPVRDRRVDSADHPPSGISVKKSDTRSASALTFFFISCARADADFLSFFSISEGF